MLIFLVIPSLLFIPILYYSLTTPFGLVDDYEMWRHVHIFNGSFSDWLNHTFLNFSDRRPRYRPFGKSTMRLHGTFLVQPHRYTT